MEFVRYEQNDTIAIITINRMEALNALNGIVLDELLNVFQALPLDVVRCVIVTGAGDKAFVAGADITEINSLDEDGSKDFINKGHMVFCYIETLPIPVIAAINGFALGGGCELALSCDIRLASERASFGLPEVSLGIIPGFGGTQRLPRLIGTGKAKELLYTAKRIKADEAVRIGLVNAVYPVEQLMDAAIQLADSIAHNAPIAVRACKKAVNDGLQVDIDTGMKIEAEQFHISFLSEDRKMAMKAFTTKAKVGF